MAAPSPQEFLHARPAAATPTAADAAADPITLFTLILSRLGVGIDITKLTSLLFLIPFVWNQFNHIYSYISDFVSSLLWCRLECDSVDDETFTQLVNWLAQQPFASNSRNLVVTTTAIPTLYDDHGHYIYDSQAEAEENKGFDFTPAVGFHRFWYKGYLIFYNRYRRQGDLHQHETIE